MEGNSPRAKTIVQTLDIIIVHYRYALVGNVTT